MKNYKIAVAGTGYVGLSIATLLSQHHQVTAVDIVPEKVELIYVLLFLSYKNLKTWMFILLELYNIFIFSYTNSRAGFLMASLLVLCVWAIKSKVIYKIFKSFGKSLCYSYPFLAVLSFATPYFINTLMKYEGLGTFLSRFKTGTAILTTNILTLFGNGNIKTDYGFVFIGFQYGLVVLLVYILANTALMKKFFRQRYYIEFFIVLIYAIYTIVESYSASILMNTSLILLSILLYQNNKNTYLNGGES